MSWLWTIGKGTGQKAYADGAASLGFSTEPLASDRHRAQRGKKHWLLRNMNPVVLSLFAALFSNDLLDLKARQEPATWAKNYETKGRWLRWQENIKLNDPKEPGTSLPDYSAVMLRSLAVFLGMIQAQHWAAP